LVFLTFLWFFSEEGEARTYLLQGVLIMLLQGALIMLMIAALIMLIIALASCTCKKQSNETARNIVIISVTRSLQIACPVNTLLEVIWDIRNLARYEPKVISARVQPQTEKTGTYSAWGFFGIIPWKGRFSYVLTENGFSSEMLNAPFMSLKVKGGFFVAAAGDAHNHSHITHCEVYQIPRWMKCFSPLLRKYIHWSMGRELNNIAQLASSSDG
jgi:hypothetical protein